MGSLYEKYRERARYRCRVRDLGIQVGRHPVGPLNAITDVKGVRVGHATLIEGTGKRRPGQGPVRTGVTAILPNDDIFRKKLVASGYILNGAGELAGLTQIMEWGLVETPIMLTNTHSVGRVSDSVVKWMARRYESVRDQEEVVLPVVGECDDSYLNDIVGLHVRPEHVYWALDSARSGPVEEGCVGAGTGMICCDLKAGIGTSSRTITLGDDRYHVGALVLSNFGEMRDLRVAGYPIGGIVEQVQGLYERRRKSYGSIIVVVATDLPMTPLQINRICKRAALGIGRVGTYAAHGSGEIVMGFSTGNVIPGHQPGPRVRLELIPDRFLDPAYQATIEATEEAILNSMTAAVEMDGVAGHRVPALDLDLIRALYGEMEAAGERVLESRRKAAAQTPPPRSE